VSKRIVEMSLSEFCDYVSANPGGARKAYEIRKEGGGDMGSVERERVVYKDRVVEKEVEVEVEVVREVERVVEKERVVKKNSKFLLGVSGVFFGLWMLSTIGYNMKEVNPVSYVDREVERVVEVPVEVERVVKVVDEEMVKVLEATVEVQGREIERLRSRRVASGGGRYVPTTVPYSMFN